MPSFFITQHTYAYHTLTAGEIGVIYPGATLAEGFDVVTMSGNSNLLALGSVVSSFGTAVLLTQKSGGYIQVGQTGSIVSGGDRAIAGSLSGTLSVQNAGLISGTFRAIDVGPQPTGGTTGGLTLVNSGTISSGAARGVTINTHAALNATVNISNTGDILAAPGGTAVRVQTGSLTLDNDGRIIGGVIGGTGADVISNTGSILGNVNLGGGDNRMTNTGTLVGTFSAGGSGGTELVNIGAITGNIEGGAGMTGGFRVVNASTIIGNITSESSLTYDGRGGRLNGIIFGSSFSDSYYLDDPATRISDSLGGMDTVYIGVNYTLQFGIENLVFTSNLNNIGRGNQLDNRLTGNTGNDALYGLKGDDILWGGLGDDLLHGGDGNDHIYAGGDNDSAYGGLGNDTLQLESDGTALFHGGAGDDELLIGFFGDAVDGDHTLYGGAGNDQVYILGTGNFVVDGGAGIDSLNIAGADVYEIDLGAGTGIARTGDVLTQLAVVSIEELTVRQGTGHLIRGSDAANRISTAGSSIV